LSRSVQIGKIQDVSFSKDNAKDFLDCHAYVLNLTKTKCYEEYDMVYNCISSYGKSNKLFPKQCVNLMEFFINCS